MEKEYTDFYATVKLKNSEEIFSVISPSYEGDKTFLLLYNPVTIDEVIIRGQHCYKIDPWLKTAVASDIVIVNMDEVLTIVECFDDDMIKTYNTFLRRTNSDYQKQNLSRKMGYITNINAARSYLEKLYKS